LIFLNKKTKIGKAIGNSLIAGDIYKHAASALAFVEFPLYFKIYQTLRPPLQWRGGVLCELFKNKGSPSIISNYRDICISDSSAKVLGKLVRHALLPAARGFALESQWGSGLHGGETAITHLYVRNLYHIARVTGQSLSLLFLDITSAFASLVRRIIFDIEAGDEHWLLQLRASGFSESEIHQIYDEIKMLVVGDKNSTYATALATQLHTFMWNTFDGLPDISWSLQGTGAGAPLADLVYVIAMAKVLRKLRCELYLGDFISTFRVREALPIHPNSSQSERSFVANDASYVDDAVIPVFTTADRLIERTSAVASTALRIYAQHGMSLNFSSGKSEAVLNWIGPKAASHERQAMATYNNKIPCKGIRVGDTFYLLIVKTYKHMGTKISVGDSLGEEVAARISAMSSGTKRLSKILRSKHVTCNHKMNVITMYLITKGFYNSGTWPELNSALYTKLHRAVLNLYRTACNSKYGEKCDDQILYELGAVVPKTFIRINRLLLFMRVICKAPRFVFNSLMISSERNSSFINILKTDLTWLSQDDYFIKAGSAGG